MDLLIEWKEISNLLSIPVETLRKWHTQYLPMPIRRSKPCPQGRVIIEKVAVLKWFEMLCEAYPSTYRMERLQKLRIKSNQYNTGVIPIRG